MSDIALERKKIGRGGGRTHREFGIPLYWCWAHMKKRCYNQNDCAYKNYGARGIRVCMEWMEYAPFAAWARSNGYAIGLEIERKDTNGHYEPSNCCWVTPSKQQRNKRNNVLVEWEGQKMCLADLCEAKGLPYQLVYDRFRVHGWPLEEAINSPKRPKGVYQPRRKKNATPNQ